MTVDESIIYVYLALVNPYLDGGDASRLDRLNPRQTNVGGDKPRVPVRVYILDQHQVPVFYCLTKILIDSIATHFFVNPNFVYGIDMKVERLLYDLEVRTPTSDQYLLANEVYRNCEIGISEQKVVVDLINLAIKGYDVMIGMDWLIWYHARLDCRTKVV